MFSGYYDNEPDEVDVPLSKRINLLNIENAVSPTSAGGSPIPLSTNANNGSNPTANSHLETLTDMNVDSDQISFQQHPSAYSDSSNYDSRLQRQQESNHLTNEENAIGLSIPEETITNIRAIDITYSDEVISQTRMDFKENYSYPENSQYYQSNQLLNSLFHARQTRQNNSSV